MSKQFLDVTYPWLIVCFNGDEVDAMFQALSEEAVLLTIDSRRATTTKGLLRSLAQTLSFPDYFGMNAGALSDCLSDLRAKGTKPLVLVFDRAEELLGNESVPSLHLLISLLGAASREWSEECMEPDGEVLPRRRLLVILRYS